MARTALALPLTRAAGVALFAAILVAQAAATVSSESLYPLSPYRMYSEHWRDGTELSRVRFCDGARCASASEALGLPTFVANDVARATFDEAAPAAQRRAACALARRNLGGAARLSVRGEVTRYEQDATLAMRAEPYQRSVLDVCD